MSKRQCPCAGCIAYVPKGLLMCAPHWRMVPKYQQDRVWATWRAVQAVSKQYPQAPHPDLLGLLRKYQAAADLAVSLANEKIAVRL